MFQFEFGRPDTREATEGAASPLRQVFTWSSMSPSETPAVVPLLPFCPFTPGSIRLLLLFFKVAAQKVTKTNKEKSEGCFQPKNRQELY